MKLLLGSGGLSTKERQDVWRAETDRFLGAAQRILFVPYALKDYDKYTEAMTARGFHAGREFVGIHRMQDAVQAVRAAEVIYVGGGNTFRLLAELYRQGLVDVIRERVRFGSCLYVGISAGTNVCGPTIKTTNDMPITMPPTLDALNLFPYQINPHYFAGQFYFKSGSELVPYAGETRDDRLREFHEMNTSPIVGLWEGSCLIYDGVSIHLGGHEPRARIFRRGTVPQDYAGPLDLSGVI